MVGTQLDFTYDSIFYETLAHLKSKNMRNDICRGSSSIFLAFSCFFCSRGGLRGFRKQELEYHSPNILARLLCMLSHIYAFTITHVYIRALCA